MIHFYFGCLLLYISLAGRFQPGNSQESCLDFFFFVSLLVFLLGLGILSAFLLGYNYSTIFIVHILSYWNFAFRNLILVPSGHILIPNNLLRFT